MKRAGSSRLNAKDYVNGILENDRKILGKAITLVESTLPSDIEIAEKVLDAVIPHSGKSIRIGITGIPGVGKSTFIEAFGSLLIAQGRKIAILAIDPTSQQSRGSILGDKTRMETLSREQSVFIRPSPSGDQLGGVASRTREVMLLCEAAGFDTIFIETVGVGQSETYVRNMVDYFLLLMIAGAGDDLQGIKRGIMEMANGIVINKADGDNLKASEKARNFINQALHLYPVPASGIPPEVYLCSATEETGLEQVWKVISSFVRDTKISGYFEENRVRQRISWLHENIKNSLLRDFYSNKSVRETLEDMEKSVRNEEISVLRATLDLLKNYKGA